jgi:HAD superfamily hydrolase (TIGR01509 family)
MSVPGPQRPQILDRLALTRDERLHLVGDVPLGEQLEGELALGHLGSPRDVHLTPHGGPMEQQRDVGIGPYLAGLARPQGRGEDQRILLQALEQHGASRRTPVLADRHKGDRLGLLDAILPRLLEPAVEQCEWPALSLLGVHFQTRDYWTADAEPHDLEDSSNGRAPTGHIRLRWRAGGQRDDLQRGVGANAHGAGAAHHARRSRRDYQGLLLSDVLSDVQRKLGRPLPEDWLESYEQRRGEAFGRELRPIDGVAGAIQGLARADVAVCVASQGKLSKTELSLELTRLRHLFAAHSLFSAYEVPRGKPHPDLFLHAAHTMGTPPKECVVVEDTPSGVRAAVAAGMRVLGYAADSDERALREAGAEILRSMEDLLETLGA